MNLSERLPRPEVVAETIRRFPVFEGRVTRAVAGKPICLFCVRIGENLLNIYYHNIYIYIHIKITLNHLYTFQISTPISPTKGFRNGWTFILNHTPAGFSSPLSDGHGSIFCDEPQVLQEHEMHNR